ncbi:UNVERIFIED_CONTAM: hypothetical protein Sangu_1662200 [Sesamum angustifolium]|uniref:Retrotransposon Copia-like N-terminal domain-containing protein n=1 Tax=Sesamum angustifolium TaxID=2727405 RepID=A0AAW2MKX5_9LAMI
MMLVSVPVNGTNWLSWSRAIRRSLGAKSKLGFLTGECVKPAMGTEGYEPWIKADCMVDSWILSAISKDTVQAYMYTESARSLWIDLESRYGQCNGPLVYQLQREIASVTQGNLNVVAYFTRLKQLWDELICLEPPQVCLCGVTKPVINLSGSHCLMHFLMGLNESFDHVRSQILVMDPLPDVNKAFSMVVSVERQRQVQLDYPGNVINTAMQVRHDNVQNFITRKGVDKKLLCCDHCHRQGHTKETCFKIHGYLDWFKGTNDQTKRFGNEGAYTVAAYVQKTDARNQA